MFSEKYSTPFGKTIVYCQNKMVLGVKIGCRRSCLVKKWNRRSINKLNLTFRIPHLHVTRTAPRIQMWQPPNEPPARGGGFVL